MAAADTRGQGRGAATSTTVYGGGAADWYSSVARGRDFGFAFSVERIWP